MRGRRVAPSDPAGQEIGEILSDLRDRVRDLEQADQGGQRSIDDGALEVYDDDDTLRGRVGKQPDGSYGVKSYGKKPQIPTEPDVIPVPGGCIVEWEGTFEDAQEDDVQRVAIHVGTTPDFDIVTGDEDLESDEESTEKAAILSPRGGSAFLALDPGQETYYVRLTAIAEGGVESDPTDAVEVIIAAPEAAFYQDEFTLAEPGASTLNLTFTPLDFSDHLYWNGLYQREDVAWTRIGKTVTLTGTPYPAKVGDRVVVEYAYNPGEEPKPVPLDGQALRMTEGQEPYIFEGLPGPFAPGGPFTVEALVRLRSLPTAERIVFAASQFPSWKDHWRLHVTTTGQLRMWIAETSVLTADFANGSASAVGGSLADGVGHHVAVTYEHPTARVYVDGTEVIAVSVGAGKFMHQKWGVDLIVGNLYISNLAPPMDVDEVASYNRRLPESEIDAHVEAWTTGTYPGTVVGSAPTLYARLDTPPNGGTWAAGAGAPFDWYQPNGQPDPVLIPAIQRGE